MNNNDWNRSRAHRLIMNRIMMFSIGVDCGGSPPHINCHAPFTTEDSHNQAQAGDLCTLMAAPYSEWYLSWLIEVKPGYYDKTYVMQSTETGKICEWSNIGVRYLRRDEIQNNWRWTDRQFAFNDRWMKVCRKHGAYITLPVQANFGDGHSVTIGTRTRHALNDKRPTKTYDDWRKVTMAQMGEFYLECCGERPH